MDAPAERVDVVIVGAGPTGLTAARLCERLGLTAVVLERRDGPQRAPAAHAINARTFEIWRQAGAPVAALRNAALAPAEAGWVHFVTRLGGEIIGSLPYERQGDEMTEITPTPLRNLSQHRLEPILAATTAGVRYRHALAGFRDTGDSVSVDIDGPEGRYRLDAAWLLGADGAASTVRRDLDIAMEGPRTIQSFVMIHLGADLGALAGDPPGVLTFVLDPEAGGVFVSHGPDREWVYMHEWDPETEPIEAFDDARCRSLVTGALAPDVAGTVEFDVLAVATWHMSAQVAAAYGSGRVFLVGDAAHRFPPTGGLGLNSGVADAHNLIWKLAAVEAGWATSAILDTYEAERRPVARFNCDQSLRNALGLAAVPAAFDYATHGGPSTTAMEAALADPDRRAAVGDAIAAQAVHFDLLGLQLGHAYAGPLVLDDGTDPPPGADSVSDYAPSTRPGGRLPHAWIDGDAAVSTLDLIDPAVPTVLRCHRTSLPAHDPADPGWPPTHAAVVPEAVWTGPLGLDANDVLVVRPDQHIAHRGPGRGLAAALTHLFPAPARADVAR